METYFNKRSVSNYVKLTLYSGVQGTIMNTFIKECHFIYKNSKFLGQM